MNLRNIRLLVPAATLAATLSLATIVCASSWSADNGNGTFIDPIFYDEFSDPDMIRVGEDFYLAGTIGRLANA